MNIINARIETDVINDLFDNNYDNLRSAIERSTGDKVEITELDISDCKEFYWVEFKIFGKTQYTNELFNRELWQIIFNDQQQRNIGAPAPIFSKHKGGKYMFNVIRARIDADAINDLFDNNPDTLWSAIERSIGDARVQGTEFERSESGEFYWITFKIFGDRKYNSRLFAKELWRVIFNDQHIRRSA